ncbi:hypothetical protein SAMN04489761_0853 [Tenacibaculum sp. MAR_2009_124]|uniref:hypothetical protein n=1 Tax=Tenacibaculum sp. MAR_2009_124 TaxID=1250059 RepID=UPI00089B7578|nr:hypothetical protein [Tenacibaculum sp. MAR_2009_124]SEB46112.1 hypothetical protein SAMN04489761_0853 [Tenacibaculum sp. MAR_2009_124]
MKDNIRITISGEIQKEKDDVEFTENERLELTSKLIEFFENRGLVFIGVTK